MLAEKGKTIIYLPEYVSKVIAAVSKWSINIEQPKLETMTDRKVLEVGLKDLFRFEALGEIMKKT